MSELPDYVAMNRNISGLNTGEKVVAPASGIHLSYDSLWTGFYPNWDSLLKEEKDKVFSERKANRAKNNDGGGGTDGKYGKMKTELKQLKSALGNHNIKIATLKTVNLRDGDDKDEDTDEVGDDAGNAFKKNKTD